MPASEHMVVIEKNRHVEFRLLMAGGAKDRAGDSQPRKTEKRRRVSEQPGKGRQRLHANWSD